MSKRSEETALRLYPESSGPMERSIFEDRRVTLACRRACEEGYEQAEKDTIAKIREQVEKWMPDNPEGDEYTSGERVAFRSVLHLLKEMEE